VDKILKTKKLSIGDYVLTGGEIPAMVLIDSISRQVEGVLGNFDSREEERVSSSVVYTRPEVLVWPPSSKTSAGRSKKKYKVSKVLLSGDHKKIEEWKKIK
jgi:tRNA (guanine37-N1)-methyltransferase